MLPFHPVRDENCYDNMMYIGSVFKCRKLGKQEDLF